MRQLQILFCVAAITGPFGCLEPSLNVTVGESGMVADHLLSSPPKKMDQRLDVDFDGKITLLGYDIAATQLSPGKTTTVTWYWQCKQAPGPGWRLFTHVLDAKGTSRINKDSVGPIRKHYQPEHWKAGMVIRDPQRIELPASWSSPSLEIRVGLWRKDTRMPIRSGPADGSNRAKGPVIATSRTNPLSVKVPFSKTAPEIDGKIEGEAAWKEAADLVRFSHTISGERAERATDVRVMWDHTHLYVAMWAEDDHIKSRFKKRDDELWHDDAFEVFLDPKGDQKNYFEIQVSPAGVVFDSFLPAYRKNKNDWSSQVVAKVSLDGTLNEKDDRDQGWTAELAIPFAALAKGDGASPLAGDRWRANFFRVDVTKDKPLYSAWSPPLRGDFHALNRFGELVFEPPPGNRKEDAGRPVSPGDASTLPKPQ